MAKTISQRISLEGSEDIRKQLEALGKAGETAFKQIQDAAKKPITDPAQIEKSKQAVDQLVTSGQRLSQQFDALGQSANRFGQAGTRATQEVTQGLNQTDAAAAQASTSLISSANAFRIAAAGVVAGILGVVSALRKGAVETGAMIADQAGKIGASIPQWLALRKAIEGSSISNDDFVKSAAKIAGIVAGAQGGVARLSDTVTETVSKFGDATVKIVRFNDRTTDARNAASQTASELVKLGVPLEVIARGNTLEVMKSLAAAINRIPDATQRAAAGAKFFGENWQEMVKILTAGDLGKAARDLNADQVKRAKELKEAWDDLGKAILSLKNNIGALFIGGTEITKWLTDMVDRTRALVQEWGKLTDLQKPAFLNELGDSPAEFLFKTLIAVGQQLGKIWTGILVPAGQALVKVFKQIADSLGGISGSQVTAFFIAAAIAVTGLAVALGAVQLILAPLMALFSPLGAILLVAGAAAVRFWGVLVAGAQRAAALIPNSLALIQAAFRSLFAGNFAAAWTQFAEGATAAFATLTQAAIRAQGPIGTIARGLQQVATDFPAAVKLIVAALIGLGTAAAGVANIINKIFGTQLTATDVALIAIVLQLTGGLTALAAVFGIVAGALAALVSGLSLAATAWTAFSGVISVVASGLTVLVAVLGGPLTAAIIAVGALIVVLVANWDAVKAAGVAAWEGIGIAIQGVIGWINSAIEAIGQAISAMQRLLTMSPEPGTPGGGLTDGPVPPGLARGGYVRGPGTATSDSVLARLSAGEYVMNARAVKHFGAQFFSALNALRRPPGFAAGGLVNSLPRFAAGGMVPALAGGGSRNLGTLRLSLPDGTTRQVQTDEDTVQALERVITRRDAHSAGRKPSWY